MFMQESVVLYVVLDARHWPAVACLQVGRGTCTEFEHFAPMEV